MSIVLYIIILKIYIVNVRSIISSSRFELRNSRSCEPQKSLVTNKVMVIWVDFII